MTRRRVRKPTLLPLWRYRTTGKQCGLTATGDYQPSLRSPWLAANDLSNKLATRARAKHAISVWRKLRQSRTLAFCVSRSHAEFMADYFSKEGIRAAAVHAESELPRHAALRQLEAGVLEVIFSVDLFNEGTDLPAIDTVMMLRPTESKILFLQQLGRGLRLHPGKGHVQVLDFIGNHKAFLNKPESLFGVRSLREFVRRQQTDDLPLPKGCYANYELGVIDFLKKVIKTLPKGIVETYEQLKSVDQRRPSAVEMYRAGVNLKTSGTGLVPGLIWLRSVGGWMRRNRWWCNGIGPTSLVSRKRP